MEQCQLNPPKKGSAYSSLADLQETEGGAPASVCIVTPDLLGPTRNGGIGTACSYLAFALTDYGHKVHILLTQFMEDEAKEGWVKDYEDKGIKVALAAQWGQMQKRLVFPGHAPLIMAKIAQEWLSEQPPFDIILFMDWQGAGFYAMQAKACGMAFGDTAMVVATHSPSLWHSLNNAAFSANPADAITWHMERKCIEMADAVISPSAYMLHWCEERHFRLPEHVYAQPNILDLEVAEKAKAEEPIRETVFFGRLEYRKGLEQFCAAMDILARNGNLPAKVTFLGKAAWMGQEHSVIYIARRSKQWNCQISLELHMDHAGAMKYLRGPGRMAVMPSVADNSPYTVYECLAAGIPFLARGVGGTPELVALEDQGHVLFGGRPMELAEKIAKSLGQKPFLARPAFDLKANIQAWQKGLPRLAGIIRAKNHMPLISVCLVHYNRPRLLRMAVDSLLAQNYQKFELLLADDGSPAEESKKLLDDLEPLFSQMGWRIFRLENGYVGKARNFLARHAQGEWLLFFDDDNIAMPDMLEHCARAAMHRKGGFISLMFNVFEGEGFPEQGTRKETYYPVGDIVAYSPINNVVGDATSLVNKKSFAKVGGFTEDYGLGHEDFELFLRLILAGEPACVIPRPLFWYRRTGKENSMLLSTNECANRMRSLRPLMEMLPAGEADLALIAAGMGLSTPGFGAPGKYPRENAVPRASEGVNPQSQDSLARVAESLADENMGNLARQIFNGMNSAPNPAAQAVLISAKAVEAARMGDMERTISMIRDFLALKRDNAENARFYWKIIKNLPGNASALRAELVRRLAKITPESIDSLLLLAAESAKASNGKMASDFFAHALELAEKAYLEHRLDVAEAVSHGDFICALHHYALHGKNEKMRWPCIKGFRDCWALLKNERNAVKESHMECYKYNDEQIYDLMIKEFC